MRLAWSYGFYGVQANKTGELLAARGVFSFAPGREVDKVDSARALRREADGF
jgi:hypothetical protein